MLKLDGDNLLGEISEGKSLVVFGAEWCAPCKALNPILESLSSEVEDIKFIKVDCDVSMQLAQEHKIKNVPTMIIFNDGVETERIFGTQTKEKILEVLGKRGEK